MSPDPRFAMHALWLGFADRAMERAWWADHGEEALPYLRTAALTIALAWLSFTYFDIRYFPEHLGQLFAVRFGFVLPVLLGGYGVASWTAGRDRVIPRVQEFVLAVAIACCLAMVAMGWFLSADASRMRVNVSSIGFMVTLIAIYGLSRLRFSYATGLGVVFTSVALGLLARLEEHVSLLPELAAYAFCVNAMGAWTCRTLEVLGRREFVRRVQLAEARARSDSLLRNALPGDVAERLKGAAEGDRAGFAERYESVTIVLADVSGFTPLCERVEPEVIADLLDRLFSRFDALGAEHGAEKIKTLGDAWLGVAGAPAPRSDHVEAGARLALAMREAVASMRGEIDGSVALRIGLHVGPAVGGVIGRTRFAYDLWGDAVDGAVVMERGSAPGRVRVSERAAKALQGRFEVVREGDAWWLEGPAR